MKEILNINYDSRYVDICNLDMYLPDVEKPCPVFIYFHGGGLESGSKELSNELKSITNNNIAIVSVEYHKYPNAKYPDFILDAAKAIEFIFKYNEEKQVFSDYFIGGSSAGAYIAMMLYFNPSYLKSYGIDLSKITGWFFNSGQPTVHFNVLKEKGLDPRLVRIDEAAPIYYIDKDIDLKKHAELMFVLAEEDVPGRLEETHLLINAMCRFNYDMSKVTLRVVPGCKHCGYKIQEIVVEFIQKAIFNKKYPNLIII